VTADLNRLGPVDLFLLAGDTTDRNDLEAYDDVLRTIRSRVSAPIAAVFGNNEYSDDHPTYVARFADRYEVRFLQDETAQFSADGRKVRVVGSLGCLDRPTWWQRKNMPHLAEEYRRRIGTLDDLLAGDDLRILLTHYPPTYVTMGAEKEEWRAELGCKALEPVLLRRRPRLVVHGHIHKGTPTGELRPTRSRLDDFTASATPVPVQNVAYPVRRAISIFDV
jgi:Icc-related predicted phosphoesterase